VSTPSKRRSLTVIFIVFCVFFLHHATVGALLLQRQKITSTPRGVGAQFGFSMAVSGNTMVVGARHDATTAPTAGAAYVFVRNGTTWTQQAQLLASDGATSDEFGYSVAISGDTVVVGAFHANAGFDNNGAAYVFVRNGTTWTQQQKLTANDATASDEFGNAVAIEGDVIAVGAHFADLPSNSEAGSVYRFNRSGTVWTQVQRVVPIAPFIGGNHFGESLSASAGRLAIGASGDNTPFTAAGAVYVFGDSSGSYGFHQKLTIGDGSNGDRFGNAVALDGDTLVGGAKEDTPIIGEPAHGSAYVFQFGGGAWSLQQKLTASDEAAFDRFGWSVAVSGNTVVVGAREDDTTAGGPDAGSAYVFTRSGVTWTEIQKLAPTDTFNGDRFGSSVALSLGNPLVGAAEKQLSSPNGQGAVYAFGQPAVVADFDGDHTADVSVFRPSTGTWYLLQSQAGFTGVQFGLAGDLIVPADYDGDGKTDVAIFRNGTWYWINSSTSTVGIMNFGLAGDIPQPGDFTGDGRAELAIYRAGAWWTFNLANSQVTSMQFGISTDKPVAADYDGDGRTDQAVYRNGTWYVNRSTGGFTAFGFGLAGDQPVPADYDGDGMVDAAVYRNGTWYMLRSSAGFTASQWGISTDVPAPADFDGDGRADIAVYRNGTWYILRSTAGTLILQFGLTNDQPIPNAIYR
jgi:hypothetical protein